MATPIPSKQSELTQQDDYNRAFMGSLFLLTVDGKEMGYFTSVKGIEISVEVIEQSEVEADGGGRPFKRKEAGSLTFGDVTLERGWSADDLLTAWVDEFGAGAGSRTAGSIQLLSADGQSTLDTIEFQSCWPKSWSGGDLGVDSDAKLTETLVMAVEGVIRK